MTSDVWVWAWLPGDSAPTLCGRFDHTRMPGGERPLYRGRFVYGKSYLANPDALPLDPLQLRLTEQTYETLALQGFFGPLRDAMPDDWGRYVIDRQLGPQAELTGYLLHTSSDAIGNLGFSASRELPPSSGPLPGLDIVRPARTLMSELEQGRPIDPALARIVRPNTALGGARPKLTLGHEGRQWIAKFPAREDRGAPIARIECAMLSLAAACGIRAANAHVIEDDVLLVERFDRAALADGGWRRDGFISAQTVFHANPAVQAYSFSGSYPRLAGEIARLCEAPSQERAELFRRMVFNAAISNTDDHERNHGFLADDTPGYYALSPAYDLVPRLHATARREHALAIGQGGFVATRDNLMSECASFALAPSEAREMMEHVIGTVKRLWRKTLEAQGVVGAQADHWAPCFTDVPQGS